MENITPDNTTSEQNVQNDAQADETSNVHEDSTQEESTQEDQNSASVQEGEEKADAKDVRSNKSVRTTESRQSKATKKTASSTSKKNSASCSHLLNDKDEDEENFCAKISNQSSNISIMCRICYDDTLDEPIISPCRCKGTVGMMHKSCLEKWLAESNTNRCDLCFHRFETERTTKFSVHQSIYRWLRYPPASFAFPIRDMRSDMITCLILIPFSFLLIYLCLFAAEYYNRQNFSVIPVARWTAISVMFMGIVIILGFSTWIYLVFRYHSRVWYFWWQRETIVRIHIQDKKIANTQT